MRVERLRLVLDEPDAAAWALRLAGAGGDLDAVQLFFETGRIRVEGRFRLPLVGHVPFRTAWTPEVTPDGGISLKLEEAAAFGAGGSGFLKGALMERIKRLAAHHPGVRVEGDTVTAGPAAWETLPVPVRLTVRSIAVEPGRLTIEA